MVCRIILTAVIARFMAAAYICMHAMPWRCIAATTWHEIIHKLNWKWNSPCTCKRCKYYMKHLSSKHKNTHWATLAVASTTLPCLHVQNGKPASVQNLLSSCEQVSTNPRPAFGEPKISLDCLTVGVEWLHSHVRGMFSSGWQIIRPACQLAWLNKPYVRSHFEYFPCWDLSANKDW